jgi:glycerol kinase
VSVILSLDAGTTGVRTLAIDRDQRVVASAYREFPQHFPEPGWVEHDLNDIWEATLSTMTEVAGLCREPVSAIGITNQRETIGVWSRSTGVPLRRAIVWQDRRTSRRCEELCSDGLLPLVRATTGLVLDPYFSGSKLEWMARNGTTFGSDVAIGTIDTWLLFKLTAGAVHATDPSNASRTMLFDIHQQCWSSELCELFGVPIDALPRVLPSSGQFGVTASDAPCGPGIPIAGIAGDQQSALFGQCCFDPGDSKNTYGTGSFALLNTGARAPDPADGLLSTIAWTIPGALLGQPETFCTQYALEGSIFVTGAAVQWLRDGLGIIERAEETETLARTVKDNGGIYFVPAFAGLGSPYWDPHARGTIIGITRGTTRGHLCRAALEAMAYQTRDVLETMVNTSGVELTELRVDGGATASLLMLELVADQLGVPVIRPVSTEITARGAASLAGLAVGMWGSLEELRACWQESVRVQPHHVDLRDRTYAQWRRAVERSREWTTT